MEWLFVTPKSLDIGLHLLELFNKSSASVGTSDRG